MKKTTSLARTLMVGLLLLYACTPVEEKPMDPKTEKIKDKPQVCDPLNGNYYVGTRKNTNFKLNDKKPVIQNGPISGYTHVLYLEFYGDTVQTAYWQNNTKFYCDSSFLSESQIQQVMVEVAKDFEAFPKLLVTRDKSIYNSTPISNRQKVIITDSHEWYGTNAAGVSYVGTLFWQYDVPNFVFSELLGYSTKRVWETTSHELGHSIGLYHQQLCVNGTFTDEYNGSVVNGNSPIMGYVNPTANGVWWVGPYNYDCRKLQKDSTFIKSALR